MRPSALLGLGSAMAVACHAAPPVRTNVERERAHIAACDSAPPVPRRVGEGALSRAERDSILNDVARRRAAWRARGITSYRIRVATGCFCPWPSKPAVLVVRGGVAVALRDTLGKAAGPLREPWSANTVEAMFDMIERAANRDDVVEATYDPCLGYPTSIRGDGKLRLPDDWYWVTASRLEPEG